jgi:anti-anti-sigma factor
MSMKETSTILSFEENGEEEISIPVTQAPPELVLKIIGRIEYEWCLNLKQHLLHMGRNHPDHLLHLDLSELDFIGSSSILHFVDVIKAIHHAGILVKLTNVQMEFIKVFQLYQLTEVPIHPPQEVLSTHTHQKVKRPHHKRKEQDPPAGL